MDKARAESHQAVPDSHTSGSPQTRTFDPAYDQDWIALHMTAGQTYILQTGELSGRADTILQLYAPDCVVLLAENDDHGGELWSRIEWRTTQTANYYLRVQIHNFYNAGWLAFDDVSLV